MRKSGYLVTLSKTWLSAPDLMVTTSQSSTGFSESDLKKQKIIQHQLYDGECYYTLKLDSTMTET